MSILRSFTINLYQLFLNKYKGQTHVMSQYKTTIANIRRSCIYDSQFAFDLFKLLILNIIFSISSLKATCKKYCNKIMSKNSYV